MIAGKPFNPATETSRRPTPEKFAHLRGWVAPIEHNIEMASAEQLADVNQQLEQVSRFYISSIIQRTISQLTAKLGSGFVTLEGTPGGALHVAPMGTGQTLLSAVINETTADTNEIIAATAGKRIKITGIVLTVAGETNLTFLSAAIPLSGPMDFGADGEPRGMVHALGNFPLQTAEGEAFNISSSAAVQQSGYVTYYTE